MYRLSPRCMIFLALFFALSGEHCHLNPTPSASHLDPGLFLGMHLDSDTSIVLDRQLGLHVSLTGNHPLSRQLWLLRPNGNQIIETDGERYSHVHPGEVIVDSVYWAAGGHDLLNDSFGIEKWKKYHLNQYCTTRELRYLGISLGASRLQVVAHLRSLHPTWHGTNILVVRSKTVNTRSQGVIAITAEFRFHSGILNAVAIAAAAPNQETMQ